MGPPGSGKGTQAKVIGTHFGIPAISTGDIFRANVTAHTSLGLKAQRYMEAGEYVPDEITNAMVRDRLNLEDCESGFLLDGYPRTVDQVHELDGALSERGQRLDCVLVLTVHRDELVQRLLQRARLEGRTDDTEDVIRRRQEVYDEQTAPLIESYSDRGLAIHVEGMGEIDKVTHLLFDALQKVLVRS